MNTNQANHDEAERILNCALEFEVNEGESFLLGVWG